jgi:hypothetical protein
MEASGDKRHDPRQFSRINTLITRDAFLRVKQAREVRAQSTVGFVSSGLILDELIKENLPPHPGEARNGARRKKRKAA